MIDLATLSSGTRPRKKRRGGGDGASPAESRGGNTLDRALAELLKAKTYDTETKERELKEMELKKMVIDSRAAVVQAETFRESVMKSLSSNRHKLELDLVAANTRKLEAEICGIQIRIQAEQAEQTNRHNLGALESLLSRI